MTATAHPLQIVAATRARTAANVARDRFAAPETMSALQFIAAHFDAAATACDAYDGTTNAPFMEMWRALADARELITRHKDSRLPAEVIEYVTAPLTASPLPTLPRLLPPSERDAAEEATLRAELDRLHADTEAADADTESWFRAVLAVLAKWKRLEGAVDVDNRRPCNRVRVAELHLKCIACGGSTIRFSVREWAVCECGKGQTWGDALVCDCGYDCPAIRGEAAN
ncbi:hypothetical protein [Streptomyces cavernicola]|uniref:Uncharacterized protein n=1 Tax=Streptomyces cavernicola TaxID=3043613 RepID=A0ABT6SM75_9ACTN|nr:hypothetical protein [Streptomyces sp. B-S-A6]MDI3409285.1 hypothetical protein [Streptomyces sp. B-S-A6]